MRESEMMTMRQRRKIWKGLETARLASCSRYGHRTSYARQLVILQNREDETIVLIDFIHDVSSIVSRATSCRSCSARSSLL